MQAFMRCPISGEVSEVFAGRDYKEFDCPTCGRFRISKTVLKTHAGKHRELRVALRDAQERVITTDVPMIANLAI